MVRLKISLCLSKHHFMKMYGRIELYLQALITSALDGGVWSHSRLGRIKSGERAPGIHLISSIFVYMKDFS
jgi:hypothetical protein